MSISIQVKRAYDEPTPDDGTRVLVDRLWPRGVSKEDAKIDVWAKDLTPSTELRNWFHDDPEKHYEEFTKKYHQELLPQAGLAQELTKAHKHITLVTAVKDIDHSHIPTLKAFLEKSL